MEYAIVCVLFGSVLDNNTLYFDYLPKRTVYVTVNLKLFSVFESKTFHVENKKWYVDNKAYSHCML